MEDTEASATEDLQDSWAAQGRALADTAMGKVSMGGSLGRGHT